MSRDLLEQLAELSRQVEAHRTAIWLLEQKRLQLRERLIAAGWKAPSVCTEEEPHVD